MILSYSLIVLAQTKGIICENTSKLFKHSMHFVTCFKKQPQSRTGSILCSQFFVLPLILGTQLIENRGELHTPPALFSQNKLRGCIVRYMQLELNIIHSSELRYHLPIYAFLLRGSLYTGSNRHLIPSTILILSRTFCMIRRFPLF